MSIFGENKKKTSFVNSDFVLHHMYISIWFITSFWINSVYASEKKIFGSFSLSCCLSNLTLEDNLPSQ